MLNESFSIQSEVPGFKAIATAVFQRRKRLREQEKDSETWLTSATILVFLDRTLLIVFVQESVELGRCQPERRRL